MYAPAVTVTGGQQESESLSGSGVFIGSDVIQENNYDNIDQVLKTSNHGSRFFYVQRFYPTNRGSVSITVPQLSHVLKSFEL